MGFKEEEERPRPEFAAKAPFLEKNPITGIKEPHFPDNLRLKRVVVGAGLICFMVRILSDHKIFPFEVKLIFDSATNFPMSYNENISWLQRLYS